MALRQPLRSLSPLSIVGLLSVMLSGCGAAIGAAAVGGHFAINEAVTGSYTGVPSTKQASAYSGRNNIIQGHDAAAAIDWSNSYRHSSYPGKICGPGNESAPGIAMCIPASVGKGGKVKRADVIGHDYDCNAIGKIMDCKIRS